MQLGGIYAVHLLENGELHSFMPGDDVPDWAVKRITNPNAWEPVDGPADPAEQVDETVEPGGAPPKSGMGASRQAWADYAESKGVEIESDWKREDIIAAVENAEH